ncbi:MAG: hypothetical protein J7K04_02665 [Spirochaetales bacterium]|nr:hypothetical protein [Spirochaetales bacterium]
MKLFLHLFPAASVPSCTVVQGPEAELAVDHEYILHRFPPKAIIMII